jgi:hypothetical protein
MQGIYGLYNIASGRALERIEQNAKVLNRIFSAIFLRNSVPASGANSAASQSPQYKRQEKPHGVVAIESSLNSSSEIDYYRFQFNPTDLKSSKQPVYSDSEKPLVNYTNFNWNKGGGRTITFTLFIDATELRFGEAAQHVRVLSNVSYREQIESVQKDIEFWERVKEPFIPASAGKLEFVTGNFYAPSVKFYAPPILVFMYGDLYVRCVCTSSEIDVLLRDVNLRPVRANINVTLSVIEDKKPSLTSVEVIRDIQVPAVDEPSAFSKTFSPVSRNTGSIL